MLYSMCRQYSIIWMRPRNLGPPLIHLQFFIASKEEMEVYLQYSQVRVVSSLTMCVDGGVGSSASRLADKALPMGTNGVGK